MEIHLFCRRPYQQGRRKQQMFGQASSDARVARQLGVCGGMPPPQKIWIFKPSEIVSGAFLR